MLFAAVERGGGLRYFRESWKLGYLKDFRLRKVGKENNEFVLGRAIDLNEKDSTS
jgi:hypothetical protein